MLKPTGSLFVNLGDKYAGSGGHNNSGVSGGPSQLRSPGRIDELHSIAKTTRRNAPDRYNQSSDGIRPKSLMGLPWRYALGCIDQGWILRRDLIWSKPNGLPEPATDRARSSHEYWFHLTKEGRYYSAMYELREEVTTPLHTPGDRKLNADRNDVDRNDRVFGNNLGRSPASVWTIATDPLTIPEWAKEQMDLPDHFAAFPQEWPRRLIVGWSPPGICTACGEGREPLISRTGPSTYEYMGRNRGSDFGLNDSEPGNAGQSRDDHGRDPTFVAADREFVGYGCSCTPFTVHPAERESVGGTTTWAKGGVGTSGDVLDDSGRYEPRSGTAWTEYHLDRWDAPPTRPAVILDPFGGTGTVCGVANVLGRTGISLDLSWDYSRLGQWRVERSGHFSKSISRTEKARAGVLF